IVVGGRPYVLIDTAGIRRRSRVGDRLEAHRAPGAPRTLARAGIAPVGGDAPGGLTEHDARHVRRAPAAGPGGGAFSRQRGLVGGTARDVRRFRARVRGLRPGFAELPLLCVSATTGEGLEALFNQVARVEAGYRATVGTPALNRALQSAVAAHQPPSANGRAV